MRLSALRRVAALLSLPALLVVPGAVPGQSKPDASTPAAARTPEAPESLPAHVSGTVTDANGDIVPGATVDLHSANPDQAQPPSQTSNGNGFFSFDHVTPGASYSIAVRADGFQAWSSPVMNLASGQFLDLGGIKLKLATSTSVTVLASSEQIATQQVQLEEQQRVMGFIPNFYVVYDSAHAVPMTAKLKFQMAFRVAVDPVSFIGAAALGAINQAGNTPDYPQGAKGYGQRVGTVYADGVTDVLFGGAILPSLLHQDPRYFYQGTGTVKSRLLHAMTSPFVCRGDNGRLQPNYSSVGGDLISSALSNTYYPQSNRGVGVTFQNLGVSTAERTVSSVIQEFLLRKFTPSAKRQPSDPGLIQ